MALTSPSSLSGATLGERHRCLNSAVSRAAAAVRGQLSFADLERLPEQTPVDRLFKIELAIKLNNVDYVLNNVKHEDMLYVSRALKCKWLVERRDVINPQYLEHVLFPEMVMPAISKMKHWLYTNLTDPLACHQFYQYYKTSKFDFAVKFLRHCDNEFLESEFPKILVQITPHYLKVLAEKCPRLVKVYYDTLATDNELIKRYLKDEQTFYNSIKCILKSQPEIFLDITEKYHNLGNSSDGHIQNRDFGDNIAKGRQKLRKPSPKINRSSRLSPSATDYILRYHKSRVMAKLELYVAYLLHIPTVAQRFSVEECQEVVIKLARADYLSWWFSYANVEPMIKRVSRADRAAFKKRVFVEKDIGERVTEWPYALPASPMLADPSFGEPHVFEDQEYEPIERNRSGFIVDYCMDDMLEDCCEAGDTYHKIKTDLERLFDEFRFVGFEGTLHELRGRIGAASSADWRRDMLLVLVSKSGGHADNVSALLQLAMRLRNEPVHERAAVARSLVKRASAWRLPQHVWDTLLEYGHGLGLDGAKPEVVCREGLHAAVMRQLLAVRDCEPSLRTAFLAEFSTLTEYKLKACERPTVVAGLQRLLITAAADAEPEMAADHLELLLDVLEEYRISFVSAMAGTVALPERSFEVARSLLQRLYNARVGRRQLLRQYLEICSDDAALVNALRHEPDAINIERFIKILIDGETPANAFFRKLGVYFNEAGGLAERVRQTLKDNIAQEPHVKLARPLATLTGKDIESLWRAQDVAGGGRYKLAAALRANMHRARPAPDALALGWHEAGMKAVAWRTMRCPPAQVTGLAQKLLEERVKRTVRLALALARRTKCEVDVFSTAATIRPLAALRAAVLYYREVGEAADPRIWEIVKSYMSTVDLIPREGLRYVLSKVDDIPNNIKPEYSALLYLALDKISDRCASSARRELMKCLPDVRDDLLEQLLLYALENVDEDCSECYPALVIRYMMLSKNEEEECLRFEKIGEPLLTKLDVLRDREDELSLIFFRENLEQLMRTLQYNQVFLDNKYQCCLAVIERILTWMGKFLPKDRYFEQYVQIHATMLYFRAVRQSMKQRPEVFEDPTRKMSEGVDVVGFTFGRYVVKEVAQLKCQYFESVIELYREGISSYLSKSFMYGPSRAQLISAIVKGMLSESVGSEARLAVHVLHGSQYIIKDDIFVEIREQIKKHEDTEVQFFANAEIFTQGQYIDNILY